MAQNIYGRTRVGIRVPSGGAPSYDSDAQAFFTASGVTDLTQKNAINQYFLDLKSYSIFSKLISFNFLFSGDSTKASYNGKNPSLYQYTFSSGYTFSSSGALPNGTSSYANTGILASDLTNNYMFCLYSRTNSVGNKADFGVYNETNASYVMELLTQNTTNTLTADFPNSTQRVSATVPNSLGNFIVNNNSSNGKKIFRNNTKVYDGTYSSGNLTNKNIIIDDWGYLAQARFSDRQKSLIAIGQNFTEADCLNLATCNISLMTTLGINV